MIKKIAVICALPPERNTGMATVDLSAHSIIHTLVPDAEVTLYTYGKAGEYSYQKGELPFWHKDIMDNTEDFLNSDVFIYWGDFIHSRAYWENDRGSWNNNLTEAQLNAQNEDCAKYIFLSSLPEDKIKKAIVFGSTIITNEASDGLDDFYTKHSQRFFKHAGGVYFRDALSAAKVSPLRDNEASLACDCALLLQNSDLNQLAGFRLASERKNVGVFFGRSSSKIKMLLFSRLVGKQLGEECAWIPWFPTRRRLRWLARLFGYKIEAGHTTTGALLSSLSGYNFIVTDTYHLCVNAWRMGIPAVCIGKGAGISANSLSDKKKEIFYEMYGARKFYIFLESLCLSKQFITAVKQAATALSDQALSAQVCSTIAVHKEMAYKRLKNAIQKILL